MPLNSPSSTLQRILKLAAVILVVFALRMGQDILVPFTLAILFSFLLSPLVYRLERLHLGRIFSVLSVVGIAFFFIGIIGYTVGLQVIDLGEKLPEYKTTIHAKTQSLGQTGGLRKFTAGIRDVGKELKLLTDGTTTQSTTTSQTLATATGAGRHPSFRSSRSVVTHSPAIPSGDEDHPLRVQMVEPPPTPLFLLNSALFPLLQPLGKAAVILVLTIFILIYREDLRDRLIRLIGEGQFNVTTQAFDDAAQRVSSYLLMQLIVNMTYGIPIGIGLYLIGLPNAFLWGVLATFLRFIPYVGAWIAASMPIILSLAVFEGWGHFGLTVGLYVVIELICSNVIEVWLYSSHTGVSQVALLVAATFWTWVWGGVGLMLSTPLTVCLAVLGKYVPQLEFFNVLLGDQPVLSIDVRIYQRLFASHLDEARKLVDEALAKDGLESLYENVILGVLSFAERDRQRGAIQEEQFVRMLHLVRELILDIGDREIQVGVSRTAKLVDREKSNEQVPPLPVSNDGYGVLCLPARGEVDELAALMLMQLLMVKGLHAELCSSQALASEMLELAGAPHIRLVCVSAVPPFADLHARYICKRLHNRQDGLIIVAGLWNAQEDPRLAAERLGPNTADAVVTRFSLATTQIASLLAPMIARESTAAAIVRPVQPPAA